MCNWSDETPHHSQACGGHRDMTLMQIHEFIFCAHHKRGLIVLEDTSQRLTLAFAVHPDEVPRLARMLKGAQQGFHPLHDFIQSLLDAFLVTPTDIILMMCRERDYWL
jgi:hypothetical protein